jgi:glycosyltransferase involved in cell wall biosynthesis
VVASAVPGLAEVVTPPVGALVAPEDTAALADAVARRLGDRRLSRAEGRAGASRAARFDVHRTFDRLAAVTLAAVSPGSDPAIPPDGDPAIPPDGDAAITTARSFR